MADETTPTTEAPPVNKFFAAGNAARLLVVKSKADFLRLVELANEMYGLDDSPDFPKMKPELCAEYIMKGVETHNKTVPLQPDFEKLQPYDLVTSVVSAYAQQLQRPVDRRKQVAFLNLVIDFVPKDSQLRAVPDPE